MNNMAPNERNAFEETMFAQYIARKPDGLSFDEWRNSDDGQQYLRAETEAECRGWRAAQAAQAEELKRLQEIERKYNAINTPEIAHFLSAVENEALHQRERWGSEYDGGKTDADWFWLVGYLAGKALSASKGPELARYRHRKRGGTYEILCVVEDENNRGSSLVVYRGEDDGKLWSRPELQFFDGRFERLQPLPGEKILHHIITTAAACLNWHAAKIGAYTSMRPGIDDTAICQEQPVATAE